MLACPDCTAWHMPIARAHRDEVLRLSAAAPTADRDASAPATTDVATAALHLVA
jgi:hypothetical protein